MKADIYKRMVTFGYRKMKSLLYNRKIVVILLLLVSLTVARVSWQRGEADATLKQKPQLGRLDAIARILSEKQSAAMYNAREDALLQTYLLSQKDHLANKGVITFLANVPRYDKIRQSLELLYKNFNNRFGYPVVVFHEANFFPKTKDLLDVGFTNRRKMPSIFFQQINLSVPDWFLKKFGKPPRRACGIEPRIGYRSMCRFQAKLVYEEPIMRHFDYQWRLDDDSHIVGKVDYDVFSVLKDGGYTYGYYQTNIDGCAHNTYNLTVEYFKSSKIVPKFYHRLKEDEIFYNNFEVSNLKIWRSKQYRDYVNYMDSLGGFYIHRWGDAPIKTLGLSMFVPLREIYQFTNVSYFHHGLNERHTTKFLSKNYTRDKTLFDPPVVSYDNEA